MEKLTMSSLVSREEKGEVMCSLEKIAREVCRIADFDQALIFSKRRGWLCAGLNEIRTGHKGGVSESAGDILKKLGQISGQESFFDRRILPIRVGNYGVIVLFRRSRDFHAFEDIVDLHKKEISFGGLFMVTTDVVPVFSSVGMLGLVFCKEDWFLPCTRDMNVWNETFYMAVTQEALKKRAKLAVKRGMLNYQDIEKLYRSFGYKEESTDGDITVFAPPTELLDNAVETACLVMTSSDTSLLRMIGVRGNVFAHRENCVQPPGLVVGIDPTENHWAAVKGKFEEEFPGFPVFSSQHDSHFVHVPDVEGVMHRVSLYTVRVPSKFNVSRVESKGEYEWVSYNPGYIAQMKWCTLDSLSKIIVLHVRM